MDCFPIAKLLAPGELATEMHKDRTVPNPQDLLLPAMESFANVFIQEKMAVLGIKGRIRVL